MTDRHYEGGCLCGAARFRGTGAPEFVSHCQCTTCRKTSGTGHSTDAGFKTAHLSITGDLNRYAMATDSGNTIDVCFCPKCGSKVMTTNAAYPDVVAVNLALFDDPGALTPTIVFFTRSAVPWDLIDGDIERYETQP